MAPFSGPQAPILYSLRLDVTFRLLSPLSYWLVITVCGLFSGMHMTARNNRDLGVTIWFVPIDESTFLVSAAGASARYTQRDQSILGSQLFFPRHCARYKSGHESRHQENIAVWATGS
jgi:hypothetical protein